MSRHVPDGCAFASDLSKITAIEPRTGLTRLGMRPAVLLSIRLAARVARPCHVSRPAASPRVAAFSFGRYCLQFPAQPNITCPEMAKIQADSMTV